MVNGAGWSPRRSAIRGDSVRTKSYLRKSRRTSPRRLRLLVELGGALRVVRGPAPGACDGCGKACVGRWCIVCAAYVAAGMA